MDPQKTLSVSNITASPATTMLGVAYAAQAVANAMPNGQFPTDTGGWVNLGFAALFALTGALHK